MAKGRRKPRCEPIAPSSIAIMFATALRRTVWAEYLRLGTSTKVRRLPKTIHLKSSLPASRVFKMLTSCTNLGVKFTSGPVAFGAAIGHSVTSFEIAFTKAAPSGPGHAAAAVLHASLRLYFQNISAAHGPSSCNLKKAYSA